MANALHIKATVQPGGKIEIISPELPEGEQVNIFVVVEAEERTGEPPKKRRARDILAEAPGHLLFKTAEEVDAYMREERDSWEQKW